MSSPVTAFEKSLRSFQTGGLTYGDFLEDLKQMLAAGAAPTELQEVLGRRQAIEPMSEQAYADVAGILNDAVRALSLDTTVVEAVNPSVDGTVAAPRDRAESTPQEASMVVTALRSSGSTPMAAGRSRPQLFSIPSVAAEIADPGAAARAAELAGVRSALEAAQNRTREITELARSRIAEALKETERLRNESRKLRESLTERDGQLSALQREHASLAPALEARAGTLVIELAAAHDALTARDAEMASRDRELVALKEEHAKAVRVGASNRAHLESDLQTALSQSSSLTADLAAAHRALEAQQHTAVEGSGLLAEKLTAADAARVQIEGALRAAEQQLRTADQQLRAAEHHQTDARQLRESLTARDIELAGLRQEQAKTARLIETRAARSTQLQADVEAARARADAIESEMKASQEAAARLVANLKRREVELDTARSELGAVKAQSGSYLESLRSREWRQGYEQTRDTEPAAATAAAPSPTRVQPTLRRIEPEPQPLARVAPVDAPAARVAPARVEAAIPPQRAAPPAVAAAAAVAGVKSGAMRYVVALAGVLLVVVVLGWLISRHKAVPTVVATPPVPAVFSPGSVIQDCSTCPTMTVLPAGRFKQGSIVTDSGYSAFEGPQHWVMLPHPFAVSTNPVTVDQFAQFAEATGRNMQGCDMYDGAAWKSRPDASWKNPGFEQTGTHPVTCVSFNDATAYATWLSDQTGHTYRLPSASEWEYAARGGGTTAQPWGSAAEACANANVADSSAAHRYPGLRVFACDDGFVNTSPVGSFKANAFGLNDMLGNVFQWTQDCWSADYTGAPVDGSARTNGDCGFHELRGGSWFSAPKVVRATYRNQFTADYRTSSVGIRLVRQL